MRIVQAARLTLEIVCLDARLTSAARREGFEVLEG
jgi:hypothetical protein